MKSSVLLVAISRNSPQLLVRKNRQFRSVWVLILSSVIVVIATSCSSKSAKKDGQVVQRANPEPATRSKKTPVRRAKPACVLESEIVTVAPSTNKSFKVPKYVLDAHERMKKKRKGVGYENGLSWTYELELPTCRPEHPTATISFVTGAHYVSAGSVARALIEKRNNYQLDHGTCYGRNFVYTERLGVSISTERRREISRKVSADRSQCVYQAGFDREGDGVTYREITVLKLHEYHDCKDCSPGVISSILQIGVPEADWPYLKGVVTGIIDSYTVDWAAYADERREDRERLKKAGVIEN